jgi:FkbM family methyltransferase
MKNFINTLYSFYFNYKEGYSYSQFGEDKIISNLCWANNINIKTYMDIGANHPIKFNNTFYFYKKGIRGVNIEPSKSVFSILNKHRKNDINLNIAIGPEAGENRLFKFHNNMYNTCSISECKNLENKKIYPIGTEQIITETYNSIVENYMNKEAPSILFIDAEGYDQFILDSIDFVNYGPEILCIETFVFAKEKKNLPLIDSVISKGYSVIADTFVNTIFKKNNS